MNKVILMGRLTANPDYRQTPNGVSVCRFNIAVDRPYQKDKEKEADFISCQAWKNTADFVQRYFVKGKPIIVEGSLRNNNYTDKNGVNHYGMDVLVSNVSFTINDNTQNQVQPQGNYYQQPQQPPQQQYNGYGGYQQASQPQQYQNNQYQQAPPPNANYQQNSPQYQQSPQGYQQAQYQQQPVQQNEEIISDGEIPF